MQKKSIFEIAFVISISTASFFLGLQYKTKSITCSGLNIIHKEEKDILQKYIQFLNEIYKNKEQKIAFQEVQYIKYKFNSKQAELKFGNLNFPIVTKPKGKYFAEIDFVPINEKKDKIVLLQIGLFDLETNNKFFEISENIEYK